MNIYKVIFYYIGIIIVCIVFVKNKNKSFGYFSKKLVILSFLNLSEF